MGTWGIGTFENDDAMDFLLTCEHGDPTPFVRDALAATLDADTKDASTEMAGLAAAAIVAIWRGAPRDELDDEVRRHPAIRRRRETDVAMQEDARAVVEKVLGESELRALWEEAGEVDEWEVEVKGWMEWL